MGLQPFRIDRCCHRWQSSAQAHQEEENVKLRKLLWGISCAALSTQLPMIGSALAQMEDGPKTEKTYGVGLPRDHKALLFKDSEYPDFPLKLHQLRYWDISGERMKKDV